MRPRIRPAMVLALAASALLVALSVFPPGFKGRLEGELEDYDEQIRRGARVIQKPVLSTNSLPILVQWMRENRSREPWRDRLEQSIPGWVRSRVVAWLDDRLAS